MMSLLTIWLAGVFGNFIWLWYEWATGQMGQTWVALIRHKDVRKRIASIILLIITIVLYALESLLWFVSIPLKIKKAYTLDKTPGNP